MNSSLGGNYVKRMAEYIATISRGLKLCPPIVMPMILILLVYVCRVRDDLVRMAWVLNVEVYFLETCSSTHN